MRIFSLSILTSAVLFTLPAMAGTFIAAGTASPATVGQEVSFNFPVQYFNQEAFACGVHVNFGDGSAPALDAVKKSVYPAVYTIKHAYAKPSAGMPYGGRHIATLTPNAHGGMVACQGNGAPCNFSLYLSPNLAMATETNHAGGPPPPPQAPSPMPMSVPKSTQLPFSATQNEGVGAGLIKPWTYTVTAEASASDKAMAGITVGGGEAAALMAK